MKKSIYKILFVTAFTMVASYNIYAFQQEVEMSDLAIANVEALARGETYIPGGTCWGTGPDGENQTCYGGYTICCWAYMNVFGEN